MITVRELVLHEVTEIVYRRDCWYMARFVELSMGYALLDDTARAVLYVFRINERGRIKHRLRYVSDPPLRVATKVSRREELGERAGEDRQCAYFSVSTRARVPVTCTHVHMYNPLYFGVFSSALENCVSNNFMMRICHPSITRWSKGRKIRAPQVLHRHLIS